MVSFPSGELTLSGTKLNSDIKGRIENVINRNLLRKKILNGAPGVIESSLFLLSLKSNLARAKVAQQHCSSHNSAATSKKTCASPNNYPNNSRTERNPAILARTTRTAK